MWNTPFSFSPASAFSMPALAPAAAPIAASAGTAAAGGAAAAGTAGAGGLSGALGALGGPAGLGIMAGASLLGTVGSSIAANNSLHAAARQAKEGAAFSLAGQEFLARLDEERAKRALTDMNLARKAGLTRASDFQGLLNAGMPVATAQRAVFSPGIFT